MAAHQSLGRRDAERHHPARGRADVHRRAVGQRDALRDEARVGGGAVAGPRARARGSVPAMKDWLVEVDPRRRPRSIPSDPTTIDISPGAYGHNSLGANDGKGWAKNPVTGQPYPPEVVLEGGLRARHGGVLGRRAEVRDAARALEHHRQHGEPTRRASSAGSSARARRSIRSRGTCTCTWRSTAPSTTRPSRRGTSSGAPSPSGPSRSSGGWGRRGSRPIPTGPSYDPGGLPLVPGLIEVITKESSAPGQRHAHLAFFVGQIAVRDWLGEPGDRTDQVSGVGWVRAVDWITYQRRTFVTPAFPAFISGHSTFSRAGAEVLAQPHGEPVFPRRVRRVRGARRTRSSRSRRGRPPRSACSGRRTSTRRTRRGSRACGGASTSRPTTSPDAGSAHRVGLDAVALACEVLRRDGALTAPALAHLGTQSGPGTLATPLSVASRFHRERSASMKSENCCGLVRPSSPPWSATAFTMSGAAIASEIARFRVATTSGEVPLRREHSGPDAQLEIVDPGFAERRHVREHTQPASVRHSKGALLALLDRWQRGFARVEHHGDAALEQLHASRARAVERHVTDVDPDPLVEQGARNLFGAAVAVGREGKLPRASLGERDQLGQRRRRHARVYDEDDGRRLEQGHGREVTGSIEGQRDVSEWMHRQRSSRTKEQRVSVGRSACCRGGPDVAARSRKVVHDDTLAERRGHLRGQEATPGNRRLLPPERAR